MTDWAELEEKARAIDYTRTPEALARVVHAMGGMASDLDGLVQRMDDLSDREAFNVRAEALKAAREHVNGLPSEQPNARGYRDKALTAADRVSVELRIAVYLLGGKD